MPPRRPDTGSRHSDAHRSRDAPSGDRFDWIARGPLRSAPPIGLQAARSCPGPADGSDVLRLTGGRKRPTCLPAPNDARLACSLGDAPPLDRGSSSLTCQQAYHSSGHRGSQAISDAHLGLDRVPGARLLSRQVALRSGSCYALVSALTTLNRKRLLEATKCLSTSKTSGRT